jgi:hypothetical protein
MSGRFYLPEGAGRGQGGGVPVFLPVPVRISGTPNGGETHGTLTKQRAAVNMDGRVSPEALGRWRAKRDPARRRLNVSKGGQAGLPGGGASCDCCPWRRRTRGRRSARRRRCQGDPLEPRRNRSIWRAEFWREGLSRSLIVAQQAVGGLASLGVRPGCTAGTLLPNSAGTGARPRGWRSVSAVMIQVRAPNSTPSRVVCPASLTRSPRSASSTPAGSRLASISLVACRPVTKSQACALSGSDRDLEGRGRPRSVHGSCSPGQPRLRGRE